MVDIIPAEYLDRRRKNWLRELEEELEQQENGGEKIL